MDAIKILLVTVLCVGMVACQKAENAIMEKKTADKSSELIQEVTLNPYPQSCDSVHIAVKDLKTSFSPAGLSQLNHLFKKCLPNAALQTRYAWLQESDKIYQFQISQLPPNTVEYITGISSEGQSLTDSELQALLNQMNFEEKFIIKNQAALFLSPYQLAEGDVEIRQNPKYQVEIFSPNLPQADQVFLKAQANQYQTLGGALTQDASLSVPFTHLADWIIVWEHYLNTYPNSYFAQAAQKKVDEYQKYLFLGLENTPVLEFHDRDVTLTTNVQQAIQKLAHTQSNSAIKAKKFLKYYSDFHQSLPRWNEDKVDPQNFNLLINEQVSLIQSFKNKYSQDLAKLLDLTEGT